MRRILVGRKILNRIPCPDRVEPYRGRPFCSNANANKRSTANSGGDESSSSSTSLSNYNEQYKALENMDFMSAAKILFSDPPKKKKFGLDFHLVQLFFACLPSLAVYLVAQYARGEMRKMDAELERKKQAEFEAQAKEMELKAAEEKAAAASNPDLLEVKARLDKLEVAVTDMVKKSKKQLDDAIEIGEGHHKHKKALQVKQDKTRNDETSSERGRVSSEENRRGLAPDIHGSQINQRENKK